VGLYLAFLEVLTPTNGSGVCNSPRGTSVANRLLGGGLATPGKTQLTWSFRTSATA